MSSDGLLDEIVFDHAFLHEATISRILEPDVVTGATGVGGVWDLSAFWVALSFFRKQSGKEFLPRKILPAFDEKRSVIENLVANLDLVRTDRLEAIFGTSQEALREMLFEYRRYVTTLLQGDERPGLREQLTVSGINSRSGTAGLLPSVRLP
jgi:hypothetical protein